MKLVNNSLYIEVISGGSKGETILLRMPNGLWGMIDCFSGILSTPEKNAIILRLRELKINQLEFVALTHPHDDHYRGMSQVMEEFPPNNFWQFTGSTQHFLKYLVQYLPAEADKKATKRALTSVNDLIKTFNIISNRLQKRDLHFEYMSSNKMLLSYSLNIEGEDTQFSICSIAPDSSVVRDYESQLVKCFEDNKLLPKLVDIDHNRLSAAFLVKFGKTQIVLGGDVLSETWVRIIAQNKAVVIDLSAEAVKVSHHASTTGYCDELWGHFSKNSPPLAIITPYKLMLPEETALNHIREYADKIVIVGLRQKAHANLTGFSLKPGTSPQAAEAFRLDATAARVLSSPTQARCGVMFDHKKNIMDIELANGAVYLTKS